MATCKSRLCCDLTYSKDKTKTIMERRNPIRRNAHLMDQAVIETAGDAARAKLSTVQRGYYRDPFICHFSKSLLSYRKLATECSPIEPIIRRGTFVRTCVMDRAIASFLSLISSSSKIQQTNTTQPPRIAQIVNLGCGRDTNFLRLWTGSLMTQQRQSCLLDTVQLRWYDIDFPPIIESKAQLLRTCPDFPCSVQQSSFAQSSYYICPNTPSPYYTLNNLTDIEPKTYSSYNQQSTDIHPYHLVSFDLDQSPKDLFQLLIERHAFDPSVPTLFLLECVHMYLKDDTSIHLLNTLCTSCDHPFLTLYDPILLDDSFGKVMEQHLIRRGVSNPTRCLSKYTTLESLLTKCIQCGFQTSLGCDMSTAWDTILDPEHQRTALNLERLDELEEWNLLMKHYVFVVASGNSSATREDDTSTTTLEESFCTVGKDSILGFQQGRCLIYKK